MYRNILVIMCRNTSRDVGIKQNFGKLMKTKTQGVMFFNPFTSSIVRVPIRTVNKEIRLNLPSKEGLNVQAEISILYHIEQDKVSEIISTVENATSKP